LILVDSSVWIDYFRGFANAQTDRDFDPFVTHLGLASALTADSP
jgi:hypothetical protein